MNADRDALDSALPQRDGGARGLAAGGTIADDAGRLVLRFGLAAILLFHGVFKLSHGVAWIAGPLGSAGLPYFLAYGTYIAELVAPVFLVLGLWTRIAALVIAVDLVMAILLVQWPQALTVNRATGGWGIEVEALILICAIALVLLGGGRFRLGGPFRFGGRRRAKRAQAVPADIVAEEASPDPGAPRP